MYFYPLSNHLGSLKNLFESVCAFKVKLEFAKKKEETEVTEENSHKARTRTNNKHMALMLVFKPRPHLWEQMLLLQHHLCTLHTSGAFKGAPNDQLRGSLGTHDSLKAQACKY